MNWNLDTRTYQACAAHPVALKRNAPSEQYPGRQFNTHNWAEKLPQNHSLPRTGCISSPANILLRFSAHQYLEGLALVVSWGTMWRTNRRIYNQDLETIKITLDRCAEDIENTGSVQNSWNRLTGQFDDGLSWSPVMASKVLHFLARSRGYTDEPPVPIDNLVILQGVWPAWTNEIPLHNLPQSWTGREYEAYERYMTFVLYHSRQLGWSTTDWETTLFDQFSD